MLTREQSSVEKVFRFSRRRNRKLTLPPSTRCRERVASSAPRLGFASLCSLMVVCLPRLSIQLGRPAGTVPPVRRAGPLGMQKQ
eukprot:121916-Rhodomonas_salina.1